MRRRIFPDGALRQLVDEAVLARALEARERRGEAVRVELLGRRSADDDRDDSLAQAVVRRADDRHLVDAGVAPRARPRPRADGCSRRRRRSCRRGGRRPRGRRRRRDARCRPCGTSRRGSPSRRRRAGSSSRRTPRRTRGGRRSHPRRSKPGVDRGPAGAARLAGLVAPDRERVDLGRAVVVDEHLGLERPRGSGERGSRSSPRPRSRARAPTRGRARRGRGGGRGRGTASGRGRAT